MLRLHIVENCAEAVWLRLPEARAAEEAALNLGCGEDQVAALRDLALRVGATLGVALARVQPQLPEGVQGWIRGATVYAGLRVYDTTVIADQDGGDHGR